MWALWTGIEALPTPGRRRSGPEARADWVAAADAEGRHGWWEYALAEGVSSVAGLVAKHASG